MRVAGEPSVKVPPMLFVIDRPVPPCVIGPLSIRPLVSLAAFATVKPNDIKIGFATSRFPPTGSNTLFEELLRVSKPVPERARRISHVEVRRDLHG